MKESGRSLLVARAAVLMFAMLGPVGAAAAELLPSGPSTGGEPASRASLTLNPALVVIGIIVQDAAEPLAIIEDLVTKKQATYRVGAAIAGGRVAAIVPDRVTIALPDGQLELRLAAGGTPSGSLQPSARAVPEPTAPSPPVAPTSPASDGLPQIGHAELEHLVRVLEVMPPVAPGEDRGVRIGEVRGDSPLQILGLRRGDIVRDINGRAPGSQGSLGELVQQATGDGIIRLHVERNGKPGVKYVRVVR